MRLDLLTSRLDASAGVDDDPMTEWELKTYASGFARIKAYTRESYLAPEQAYAGAVALQATLLGEEYRLKYQARIGAESEESGDPPSTWRGYLEVGVVET